MFKLFHKINLFFFIFLFLLIAGSKAEIIEKIDVSGNQRISIETIKMFSGVSVNDNVSEKDLNEILKKLYNTNFFDLVSVKIDNKKLFIKVKENPIIQNIIFEGIKSSTILEELKNNISLKSRSSFNNILLEKDKKKLNFF